MVPQGPTQLPDTEEELLALLNRLLQQPLQGYTEKEQQASFVQLQAVRIAAAEKLMELATSDNSKKSAVQTKLDALRQLSQVGGAEVMKQLNAYCREVQSHENAEIALLGRICQFVLASDALRGGRMTDIPGIVDELKSMVQTAGENPGVFIVTSQAAGTLEQLGHKEEAIEAYQAIVAAFQNSTDEELVSRAKAIAQHVKGMELNLEGQLRMLMTGEPDAAAKVVQTMQTLLTGEDQPDEFLLNTALQVGQLMEMVQQFTPAGQVYDLIDQRFTGVQDQELLKRATAAVTNGRKRVALIGQPFAVDGVLLDGTPFDSASLGNKVVLIDFWTTRSPGSLAEFANIERYYQMYRDKGFEVVGVNLNENLDVVKQFLGPQQLAWPTVIGPSDDTRGFLHPTAVKYGIDYIPFNILVGVDGNVIGVHLRGPKLKEELAKLLGPAPGETPAGTAPAGTPAAAPGTPPASPQPPTGTAPANPAPANPAPADPVQPPATQPPAGLPDTIPAPGNSSSQSVPRNEDTFFFVALQQAPEPSDTEPDIDRDVNPYTPADGLSPMELVDFIFDMQDKPKTIQKRPGFYDGIVQAADRILAAETPDKQREIAAGAKFDVLHAAACREDKQADQQLAEFAAQMKDSKTPKIAEQAAFFLLERKALDVDDMPLEEVPALLAELEKFVTDRTLDQRHLRLASATVHAANRLEDPDQREEYFQKFGGVFSKSGDKGLARYGKKLAKKPGQELPDLIGKPLELAGVTDLGTEFDWDEYRGKVVLVDFWATWCGPCVKAMPEVKALYEKLNDQGFEVVGISLDRKPEDLAKYLDKHEIAWTNLLGEDAKKLAETYGVKGIPTMMVVDRQGTVAAVGHKLETLKETIDKLMATDES